MMSFWKADALLRDQACENAKVSSIDDNVQINFADLLTHGATNDGS